MKFEYKRVSSNNMFFNNPKTDSNINIYNNLKHMNPFKIL